MKATSGLTLLEETEGTGPPASKGDLLVYNFRLFLNKGEEVEVNEVQDRDKWPLEMLSEVDGKLLINYHCALGKRDAITAIEYSLYGMRAGGYRKVKASPHLAFREEGIPGKVPANAVLVFCIWLRQLTIHGT